MLDGEPCVWNELNTAWDAKFGLAPGEQPTWDGQARIPFKFCLWILRRRSLWCHCTMMADPTGTMKIIERWEFDDTLLFPHSLSPSPGSSPDKIHFLPRPPSHFPHLSNYCSYKNLIYPRTLGGHTLNAYTKLWKVTESCEEKERGSGKNAPFVGKKWVTLWKKIYSWEFGHWPGLSLDLAIGSKCYTVRTSWPWRGALAHLAAQGLPLIPQTTIDSLEKSYTVCHSMATKVPRW